VNAHREEQVSFRNGDVSLAGTLVRPVAAGRHPAVVMLHSSGHQSRNGPAAYFRLLANHFAAEGIATLIYDKRGVDQSTGDWNTASFEDLADDGAKAVELLRRREDIDPNRIGLWGISQGGWLAPLLASRSKDVSFFLTVSGAAVGTAEQETYRVLHSMVKEGFSAEDVSAAEAYMNLFFAVVKDAEPWDKLQAVVPQVRSAGWSRLVATPTGPGDLAWWKRVRDFDPATLISRLSIPSLHILGEWDDDVPTDESARILQGMPGTHRKVKIIPAADHYMIRTPRDLDASMPVLSAEYLREMVSWILQRRPRQ
jgi:dienelactone hydrolase